MSAYICNPEHFGILAAYAVQTDSAIREWEHNKKGNLPARIDTAQRIAKGLARENIRSVAVRYPDDKDGERPGPCLKDAEIEEAAAIYAAHFVAHPQKIKPLQILTLCQSYSYQSCETADWRTTPAARQIEWIQNAAIRALPGYEDCDWSFDNALPEVEALYRGEAA